MLNMKKTNLCIYETKDYEQFKLWKENRIVKRNSNLEREIMQCNKLPFHPITVTPDGFVIDGQNRLAICEENDETVYVMVDEDGKLDDIKQVQSGKVWSQMDFLHHFAESGNKDYHFMREMVKSYGVPIATIIDCFSVGEAGSIIRRFRKGEIRLKHKHSDIERYLLKYRDIAMTCKKFLQVNKLKKNLVVTILRLCSHPKFDHRIMIHKIDTYPDKLLFLNKFDSKVTIREKLVELYNYNAKNGERKFKDN